MTEGEAQVRTERALRLLDRDIGLAAGRALEVAVLDEGDPGMRRPLDVVALAHRNRELAHGRTGAALPDGRRPTRASFSTSDCSSARTAATPSRRKRARVFPGPTRMLIASGGSAAKRSSSV